MVQHTRAPARDFASQQQLVRTNSEVAEQFCSSCPQEEQTPRRLRQLTHRRYLHSKSFPQNPFNQLKESSNPTILFVICTSSPRKKHLFSLPALIHIKIHAQTTSRFFLSVKGRNFSNTIFIEADWVELLIPLPQVISKAKLNNILIYYIY